MHRTEMSENVRMCVTEHQLKLDKLCEMTSMKTKGVVVKAILIL